MVKIGAGCSEILLSAPCFPRRRVAKQLGREKSPPRIVSVRKSDRRVLLKRALQVLSVQEEGKAILDHAFLQGNLSSRLIFLSDGKATLYFQQDDKDSDIQCVWIQLDSIVWFDSKDVVDVPTIPLLSQLTTVSQSSNQHTNILLPTVLVPSPVSKFLCRGANLMKPGMRTWLYPAEAEQLSPATTPQHRIVAISCQGNPSPIAVGWVTNELMRSDGTFSNSPSGSGCGVNVVTCYGDDLWKSYLYEIEGFVEGQYVVPVAEGVLNDTEVEDAGLDQLTADKTNSIAVLEEKVKDESITSEAGGSDSLEPISSPYKAPIDASPESALHHAVCRALVKLKKSDLPMRIAAFYSQCVRQEDSSVDVKQTVHKKFGVYLVKQMEQGLISVAPDPANPQDKIALLVGYDPKDPVVRACAKEISEEAHLEDKPAVDAKLALIDLFCIPSHFQRLLRLDEGAIKAINATCNERKGTGMLTSKEMHVILDEYIQRENLVDPTAKNFILLDAPLTDALYGGKNKNRTEVPIRLSRKEIAAAWIEAMQPAYALLSAPGSGVVKISKGKPPRITLEVKRRQQRKYVTHLTGFRAFGLEGESLRNEVAQRFGMAGVLENENELMFQGNVAREMEAFLTGDTMLSSHGGAKNSPYRLPRNAIEAIYRKGVPVPKKR